MKNAIKLDLNMTKAEKGRVTDVDYTSIRTDVENQYGSAMQRSVTQALVEATKNMGPQGGVLLQAAQEGTLHIKISSNKTIQNNINSQHFR